MIEGLKVTISAQELQELCRGRAAHHTERAAVYAEQLRSMQANEIEGMTYTNGDPKRSLADMQEKHTREGQELDFYAEHLEPGEKYLLDVHDLQKLGIVTRAY